MSWRTVVISNRCKLDLKMGFMVVRGEETKRVYLDEIAILLIENPAVAMTGCLLQALVEKKVRVIFCDEKYSPFAELAPYRTAYDSSRKIRMQIAWDKDIKGAVWNEIVAEKIRNQAAFLRELEKEREAELLSSYVGQIEEYDATNREGHAAKVYFNALFGMDFSRTADIAANAALNYGYGLLLSAFNREIAVSGYLTQMGLFHTNVFNPYNFSCDLMEPYRVLVDRFVLANMPTVFEKDEKHALLSILNQEVKIANATQTVLNSIKIYCRSVFEALNEGDMSKISFYQRKI